MISEAMTHILTYSNFKIEVPYLVEVTGKVKEMSLSPYERRTLN